MGLARDFLVSAVNGPAYMMDSAALAHTVVLYMEAPQLQSRPVEETLLEGRATSDHQLKNGRVGATKSGEGAGGHPGRVARRAKAAQLCVLGS